MNFPYRQTLIHPKNKLFPNQKYLLRPVIPITFQTKNGSLEYAALIDSGADYCLFHAFIAEQIGLNVKKGKVLVYYGTSGKQNKAYFHEVEFTVGETLVKSFVGFSYDIEELDFGLLGQNGFFDKFEVKFNVNKEEIELTAI